MRPTRLEITGFTAFRETAVVDFEGCDFFALCGPTGAGKSSIIDAITFALYGSIPRLDKNDVRSIISQGLLQTKVLLDFTIGDDAYQVMRWVERRGERATTKEVRLEKNGRPFEAADPKSVTAEIERLIGLDFDQFTKCVVLPQGEFARFLHDTRADRQDLLVKLLGFGLYERMARRANELARDAGTRAELLQHRLDTEYTHATPESLAEATERLRLLESAHAQIEAAMPQIEALDAEAKAAKEQAAAARGRLDRLAKVSIPDGVGELGRAIAAARADRDAAQAHADQLDAARAAAERDLAALPDRAALTVVREAHANRDKTQTQLTQARAALESLARADADANAVHERADAAFTAAEAALDAARVAHRAHDLARRLVAGEACPVCKQTVAELPDAALPADVADAEHALASARAAREQADAQRRKAAKDRTFADATAQRLMQELDELTRAIADHPDPQQLDATIAAVEAAERALAGARRDGDAARRTVTDAQRRLDGAERAEREARRGFASVRDSLADLAPPPAEGEDLAADWRSLAEWAAGQHEQQGAAADAADRALEQIAERRRALATTLVALARDAGVEAGDERLSRAVEKALDQQANNVERIEAALQQIAQIQAEKSVAEEQKGVASHLGRHLSAGNFEQWLLDDAMQRLVAGASRALRELSNGAYSLDVDGKGHFTVIDHRNADERRSAKTLSGGETFLASLSLALALSDDIAAIAADGARLDAIFLDEGFGTLDIETLGTVQTAIENLAQQGRMVGLVTHVREIAEYVPVRFDVRKHADTSRVEKVWA